MVFANPAFYKAQAMRPSLWDRPQLIGCAENTLLGREVVWSRCRPCVAAGTGHRLGVARGRQNGSLRKLAFIGQRRSGQEAAVEAMLCHDSAYYQG